MKPRFMKNRFVAWKKGKSITERNFIKGTLEERIFIYGRENVISEIKRRLPPGYGAEYSRVCLGSKCGGVCDQYIPEKKEWLNPCDCSLCARYRPQSWVENKCSCDHCATRKEEIEQIAGKKHHIKWCIPAPFHSFPSPFTHTQRRKIENNHHECSTSGNEKICSFTKPKKSKELQNLCNFEPNEEEGFEYICTAGHLASRTDCAYADLQLLETDSEYDLIDCSHEQGVYCRCEKANKAARVGYVRDKTIEWYNETFPECANEIFKK